MDSNKGDLLLVVRELTDATNALHSDTKTLREEVKVSRKRERLLALSIILDLVLSIALGMVGLQAKVAGDRATAATSVAAQQKHNLELLCETGNNARAAQRQLWDSVIALSQTDVTPRSFEEMEARKQRLAQFQVVLEEATQQRDCEKEVNRGQPKEGADR